MIGGKNVARKLYLILFVVLAWPLLLAGCSSDTDKEAPVLLEYWKLGQGGTDTVIPSEVDGGTPGELKWGVWLNNNTFGKVLDLSTEGSRVYVKDSHLDPGKNLSISVWLLAPPREENDRVILQTGAPTTSNFAKLDGLRLYLDGQNNHELAFEAKGLTGTESSGVSLTDSKWHHILVTVGSGKLSYYIDGNKVKTCSVSGVIEASSHDLFIGSDTKGENGFDGSLAELKIFQNRTTPDVATQTVLNAADNEPGQLRLPIKHGICLDRRQYIQPEPLPKEGQTVREQDIVNCINMGFDHVKLLLTPNHLIDDDGSLKVENMEYITRVVGYVEAHNFRCILCIHPEDNFKTIYLKNLKNFEKLCKWYGELAEYIKEHWSPDTLALQLMTEPGENNPTVSWSWQSDRMWGAVRNVLPDHTILTSSNAYGNIEYLKYMSPATDSNLVYTYTSYEPYTIGWYYYATSSAKADGWAYVHDIPYPVEEGVDYTEAIEYAIDQVPDSMKEEMRRELTAYVKGEYDGKNSNMINHYDSLYNANWHMLRMKSLDDWRQKYGGNIHIMCVEFGCMDAETPKVLWQTAAECYGISDEKRIEFIRDTVDAFEAYNIGYSYWSYNEAHTVFLPEWHVYGTSPMPDEAIKMFDLDLLAALRVTPRVTAN